MSCSAMMMPAHAAAMADYHGRRSADVTERQAIISAMNTSMLAEFLPLDLMRVGALSPFRLFHRSGSW